VAESAVGPHRRSVLGPRRRAFAARSRVRHAGAAGRIHGPRAVRATQLKVAAQPVCAQAACVCNAHPSRVALRQIHASCRVCVEAGTGAIASAKAKGFPRGGKGRSRRGVTGPACCCRPRGRGLDGVAVRGQGRSSGRLCNIRRLHQHSAATKDVARYFGVSSTWLCDAALELQCLGP
jgi:hypothetical protein